MSEQRPIAASGSDRVPWPQLIAYGFGGLIPIALFNIAGQLMSLLGNISLGLSAFWLGAIMLAPRLWEAISDPVIGHLSDNTRTRWGRRRPYILIGGLAVAMTFVAMWWVPRGEWIREIFPSELAYNRFQLGYILFGVLAFFTSCAIFEIPHGALGLEMSPDPHERTRLFSAKSFLGNLFAMGTPWLILLANMEYFRGPGGNLIDGMRYVTIFIAAVLTPMAFWWFLSLREPGFALAKEQKKSEFWHDMRTTVSNRSFLILTLAIFTLATGFNLVGIFANYITIFYLFGGDVAPASVLLGIGGTVWAVTALVAVFPLNWLSKRYGKRAALLVAILLMCAAQISKIFCYRPGDLFTVQLPDFLVNMREWLFGVSGPTFTFQGPYLILFPTMLLSAGMLMFFTLGAAMVGDVCDEDELETGTRSEGSFYSVYWWFIKMGTAFAGLVMGALLVFTGFDEKQNVAVDDVIGSLSKIKAEATAWSTDDINLEVRVAALQSQATNALTSADKLRLHFTNQQKLSPDRTEHLGRLVQQTENLETAVGDLKARATQLAANPDDVVSQVNGLLSQAMAIKQQTPRTLLLLRILEIGVPLVLCAVSLVLTLRYPITEARSYEIKEALERRRGALAV
jgi:GPH family glycoside/pentoside/hexuronide:cation symporter